MKLLKHLTQFFKTPSSKERRILEALAERELYGSDFVDAKIAGRGSIYVVLARLEDKGLIEGLEEPPKHPGLFPRRRYRITVEGRAVIFPVAKKV
jgi:DNA-binding PadR family transcriptional regulator